MANDFQKNVKLKVQNKSGFDKSHQNLLTTKVGTITPLLCEEVIPNETINCKVNLAASLPPLASDTFMRCQLKTEAFFVPTRLLNGGYEEWLTGQKIKQGTSGSEYDPYMPVFNIVASSSACTQAGSLADYLGYRVLTGETTTSTEPKISALPFIAYHKIWDDWYRNSLIQKSCFLKLWAGSSSIPTGTTSSYRYAPSIVYYSSTYAQNLTSSNSNLTLDDGVNIWQLRQRNFGADYFTTATPDAQNGSEQKVTFFSEWYNQDQGIMQGDFTISALRAANSMQQFLERNNIAGNRMVDFLRAQYGANLNDGVAQRSILLGSAAFDVYSKGIYQTANISGNTNNPFAGSVGAQFGSAYASGSDFIIKGFTAQEPGYIFVMVTLVPKVTYSTGIRRYLAHYTEAGSQTDMANPILQNVGNQPIYRYELNGNAGDYEVYGYTDRYAEFKTHEDELHGLLRDGQNLKSFALQRSFAPSNTTKISSAMLRIPTTYLDQVTAVNSTMSNYGVWIDSYIDYKSSMPLAEYSIPSLQDPAYEHGHDVMVQRGGRTLN